MTIETLVNCLTRLSDVLLMTFGTFDDVDTAMTLAINVLFDLVFNPGACTNKMCFPNEIWTSETWFITRMDNTHCQLVKQFPRVTTETGGNIEHVGFTEYRLNIMDTYTIL